MHRPRNVGLALAAMAENATATQRRSFSLAELRTWCAELEQRRAATMAIDRLLILGFLVTSSGLRGGEHQRYVLTSDGVEAARSAALALELSQNAVSSAFAQRLWNLLRARTSLTSVEAASVLTNAGGDVERARSLAARLLRRWAEARPGMLQVSAQRFERAKRYVLVSDPGPRPPSATRSEVRA